ncbi:MAG: hypothetical protein AB8C84_05425 [Oligoflexales bacterium]
MDREVTDYDTYRQIMDELMRPIQDEGLDVMTLKRLYESKLVYLENLRTKCFCAINRGEGHFQMEDYHVILGAVQETKLHLRDLVLVAVTESLALRKVV